MKVCWLERVELTIMKCFSYSSGSWSSMLKWADPYSICSYVQHIFVRFRNPWKKWTYIFTKRIHLFDVSTPVESFSKYEQIKTTQNLTVNENITFRTLYWRQRDVNRSARGGRIVHFSSLKHWYISLTKFPWSLRLIKRCKTSIVNWVCNGH